MIDTVTSAIDTGYLTCRFSKTELREVLLKSWSYLTTAVLHLDFQVGCGFITDIKGTNWTLSEYFQRIYIKIAITYANLFSENEEKKFILSFSKLYVDMLTHNVQNSNLFNPSPPHDKKHHDSLCAKAEYRRFYMALADQYFALSLHQEVISCLRSILDDAENCTTEECTYQHIGYVFLNVGYYEDAGKYLKRSLEIDSLNLFQIIDIHVKLATIDDKLNSNNLFDVDMLIDACHQVADKCNDEEFFYFWRNIIIGITVVNKAGRNVTFLEDKLFSIVSTSKQEFQLHPKEAFELVNLVKQADNFTKTIQWGLLLVKPFENYDNFTVEEQIVILQIRLAISLAKFRLYNFSEALNEMESILDAVSGSPAIQNEEVIAHINDTICSYMLIWPGKYMYICHRKTSWAVIKLLIDVTMDLPKKCVYVTFVIPFDLYPPNSKGTHYNRVRQSKTNALSEQKYSNLAYFFLDIVAKRKEIIQPTLWYVDTFQAFINNNVVCIIMNTITVCIRLWLLLSVLFTIVGLAYYTAVICVADDIESYYVSSIVDPSKSLLRVVCMMLISDLLLALIHLLATILSKCSAWGIFWLQICICLEASCHRNLARKHLYNRVNIEQTIWTAIYIYHLRLYHVICVICSVCFDYKHLIYMCILFCIALVSIRTLYFGYFG